MSFHVMEVMDESARHTCARVSGDTRITNVMVRARRASVEGARDCLRNAKCSLTRVRGLACLSLLK